MSQNLLQWRAFSGMLYLQTEEKFKGGEKIGSTDILNAFYTMLGIILSSTGQLIYRQGLVFISISQGLKLASIIKSNPKIQKLFPFRSGSINEKVDRTASVAVCLRRGQISVQKLQFLPFLGKLSRYLCSSEQVSLFPGSYLPQLLEYFCMASLVRCMKVSVMLSRDQVELEVRIQPSWYQQALSLPLFTVRSMQVRISNFLPLYSSGFVMYFWIIKDLFLPNFLKLTILAFISSTLSVQVIPWPLFENYPGLMIQQFLSFPELLFLRNSLNSQSRSPFLI